MGNNVSSCVFDDCVNSDSSPQKHEVQFYKDCNGNSREFSANVVHKYNEELNFVSALDSFVMKPNDEWYVINVDWLSHWLEFAKGMAPLPPGQISNSDLVDDTKPKKLRSNLAVKRDFRCVCKEVWNFFYEKYGGGPVLYFHVPSGFDERAYRTGEWMRTASLTDLVKVIVPQVKFIHSDNKETPAEYTDINNASSGPANGASPTRLPQPTASTVATKPSAGSLGANNPSARPSANGTPSPSSPQPTATTSTSATAASPSEATADRAKSVSKTSPPDPTEIREPATVASTSTTAEGKSKPQEPSIIDSPKAV